MHSHLLQAIGDVVLDDAIHDTSLRQAIYHHIPRATLQAAVKEAYTLRRPNGYFDFLDNHYSYVRQFAPQFLDTFSSAIPAARIKVLCKPLISSVRQPGSCLSPAFETYL
jgi:hypothetical protein